MEYSVNKLTRLSGVSARTLRYYDEIGLLKPARIASSGYRIYGSSELDILRQILFFRELGFSLDEIKNMLSASGFNMERAFENHLSQLTHKRRRLDALISNVKKSIAAMKGEIEMTDEEKFEGLKQSLVDENEREYGKEIRERYGDKAVDESNARLAGLTREQYDEGERLRVEFEETLTAAFNVGGPAGNLARRACGLHKRWLCVYNPSYSKEYHKGLGEMYVADQRFRANYDKLAPARRVAAADGNAKEYGVTDFLRDAINIFCG